MEGAYFIAGREGRTYGHTHHQGGAQEFAKRQDEENKRQNKRIDELEETVRQIGTLTASVEKLAVSIESMAREQEQQGKQLRDLEAKDGEMWRKVVGYIATAIIGIVIGFIFKQIGM